MSANNKDPLRPVHHINKVYILALSLIMLLAFGKYVAMEALISTQKTSASAINLSGRQRMLSQRIALFSQSVVQAKSDEERAESNEKLSKTLSEFEQNHKSLIEGSKDKNIARLENPMIRAIYFDGTPSLHSMVGEYVSKASIIIDPVAILAAKDEALEYILRVGPESLLKELNDVVFAHEKSAREDVEKIIFMQMIFLIMTAIILLLEAIFLFSPLAKKLKTQILQLERKQQTISRQYKELERFTFISAHSLQELVRKMAGFTGRLRENISEELDEKNKEYLGYIIESVAQIRALMDALSAYARVSSHKLRLSKMDSKSPLEKVVRTLSRDLGDKNAAINYENLPEIFYDEKNLEWIFEQLIRNALLYSCDQKSIISVSGHERDDVWEFCVQDNGIGIKEEYYEKIFEFFQRLHRESEISGIGAGLALVRKLVERSGGECWVESEPDKGSRFYFTISRTLNEDDE
ncbi:MAG: type IV pili methyl-accepting chemotaxis transducer N-terminal domain-containing protein [Micavibrio sp.]|nr:type IV pili methyl-accepting chemotaxis transducer N-terminal domain-containing protein [Micavibrio sp.]